MAERIICNNISELPYIATTILQSFPNERIFIFKGALGTGKTTLIKVLCKKLNVIGLTNSPSFALINEYTTVEGDVVYHFDFYRIEQLSEVYDIGYEDYFYSGRYCFIEWPEIAENILPADYVEIKIQTEGHEQARVITFSKNKYPV